ncbi:hypothetical protein PENTCL1PPCAC_18616, partial [Pristionchus entomophagus]
DICSLSHSNMSTDKAAKPGYEGYEHDHTKNVETTHDHHAEEAHHEAKEDVHPVFLPFQATPLLFQAQHAWKSTDDTSPEKTEDFVHGAWALNP